MLHVEEEVEEGGLHARVEVAEEVEHHTLVEEEVEAGGHLS